MSHFFIKLIAPRPTFATQMSDEEKLLMQKHAAYLKDLQTKGVVLAFGPVFDPSGPFGMALVKAADVAAASAIMADDPTIKANCGFKHEVFPMVLVM